MTVPMSHQRLQRDLLEDIKTDLKHGRAVSGEDLLRATEQRVDPLPLELRQLFRAFSSRAIARQGRPPKSQACEEFTLAELDERYPSLLGKFQKEYDRCSTDHVTPSERAYRQLLDEFKDIFENIDWLALRNKHSAWRSGRFRSSEELVDSEDFEAEIERQFPAHKNAPDFP